MTFIDRETADEWWRMISTPHSRYAANIRRLSPHFYTQDDRTNNNVATFFTELPDAKRFHRKMFITMLWSGSTANMITPITITDHISGRWYFIRSRADPWSHWYFRTDDACLVCGDVDCADIHVSSEYRTKFCIQACNVTNSDLDAPGDFVMIGRDEVTIRASRGYTLHTNEAGELKALTGHQEGTHLLFRNLKDSFITRAKKQVNGEIWEYVVPVERGLGEGWEPVD